MKKVRCPKCDHYMPFDDTRYQSGEVLVFECPNCHKQFGLRIGAKSIQEEHEDYGSILVIEHCIINVSRNRAGQLIYTLRDASTDGTGTFVSNTMLGAKDRLRLDHGAIITIGATTMIFRAAGCEED